MGDDEILDRVRTFAKRGEKEGGSRRGRGNGGDQSQAPVADGGVHDGSQPQEGATSMTEEGQAVEQQAEGTTVPDAPPAQPSVNGHGGSTSGLGSAGEIRPCPVPSGSVIFGELTSAFVEGPKLLRFLGDRKHTGAVIDAGGDQVQVAILHEGDVVGMVATTGSQARRLDSLNLPGTGGSEEHQLTVLTYRPEVAAALGQLVNLPERFERMHGSFVDFPSLLSFLQRESANGGVRITTRDDTGVVLLRNGRVLGAYTTRKPELEDAEVVFDLAKASDAEIDVHVGALQVPPPSVSVRSVVK